MRVLHISSAKTFGGGERHLVDLCRALTERGHEVFVALRPTNEWQDRLDFLPPERFLHVSIRNSFGMFSAKRIGRFIERNGIDLVHAHVARDYLAASVAVRTVPRAHLVLTRHVVFPLKPFHRFALRNVEAAIAVSPVVETQLRSIFPADKVRQIPNGIDMSSTDVRNAESAAEFREFHGLPSDAKVVSTVGELKLLKGQRDLVLAANEVLKELPETRFIIAGKDNTIDGRFRRELKRLVKVLGHENSFVWLEWLEDLRPLLAATDLFVSPSHSESFGLAILEALAAGTPVVSTATDGAKELIPVADALVPVKDPIALAAAITRYLGDDDARRSLADELKHQVHERFGLDAMAAATESLYYELVPKGAAAETLS